MTEEASATLARWTTEAASKPTVNNPLLKQCALDFIGLAAFGGRFGGSSSSPRVIMTLGGGAGPATVSGVSMTCPLPTSRSPMARTLGPDDTNISGRLHLGALVTAAVLAKAERLCCSGENLLAALAAGYEVCCRSGVAQTDHTAGPVTKLERAVDRAVFACALTPNVEGEQA